MTAIGSADSYKDVLENPDTISKRVLEKGLDASTAFGIMSIDIADVDVGDNIGARLQTEQAEANKQMAHRQRRNKRRAIAVANEQEMKSPGRKKCGRRSSKPEAQIPMAMAEAFRSGSSRRHGLLSHTQNIQSDTRMRQSIAERRR